MHILIVYVLCGEMTKAEADKIWECLKTKQLPMHPSAITEMMDWIEQALEKVRAGIPICGDDHDS